MAVYCIFPTTLPYKMRFIFEKVCKKGNFNHGQYPVTDLFTTSVSIFFLSPLCTDPHVSPAKFRCLYLEDWKGEAKFNMLSVRSPCIYELIQSGDLFLFYYWQRRKWETLSGKPRPTLISLELLETGIERMDQRPQIFLGEMCPRKSYKMPFKYTTYSNDNLLVFSLFLIGSHRKPCIFYILEQQVK